MPEPIVTAPAAVPAAPTVQAPPVVAPAPVEPTTVEQLPAWAQELVKNTRAEAAKYRTEKTSAVEAAKLEAAEAAKALEDQLATTKLADLKRRTAIAAGVPADKADEFASLLQGSTEGELKAHAEKVRDLVGVRPLAVDPTQGAAGTTTAPQLTQAELTKMSPAEIVKAKTEGRLNTLLGRN